jgi:uncharacterized protein YsxB (DUF464 family)
MISAEITRKNKLLCLVAEGHADFAPFGSDIVCAGVSGVILGLSSALSHKATHTEIMPGHAVIKVPDTKENRAAFKVLEKTLELIAAEYPGNVRLICSGK